MWSWTLHISWSWVALFTFAMVNGSHLGVQVTIGLIDFGLQDGCHYHGESKQCNPSIAILLISLAFEHCVLRATFDPH